MGLRPEAERAVNALAEGAAASWAEVVRCAARTLVDAHRSDPGLLDEPWSRHAYGVAEPGPLPGDAARRCVVIDTPLRDALTAVAAERREPRSETVRLAVDLFVARSAAAGSGAGAGVDAGVPAGVDVRSRLAALATHAPATGTLNGGDVPFRLRPGAARAVEMLAEAATSSWGEVARCAVRTLLDAHRSDPGLVDEPWALHGDGAADRRFLKSRLVMVTQAMRDALTAVAAERGEPREETLRLAVDLFVARSAAVGFIDAVGVRRPASGPDLW